jgi:hypothetical protein
VIGADKYIITHRPHMKEYLPNLTWIEKADYLRYLAVAQEGIVKFMALLLFVCVMFCCVLLRFILRYSVLRSVLFCYFTLCYVMLCCSTLY